MKIIFLSEILIWNFESVFTERVKDWVFYVKVKWKIYSFIFWVIFIKFLWFSVTSIDDFSLLNAIVNYISSATFPLVIKSKVYQNKKIEFLLFFF